MLQLPRSRRLRHRRRTPGAPPHDLPRRRVAPPHRHRPRRLDQARHQDRDRPADAAGGHPTCLASAIPSHSCEAPVWPTTLRSSRSRSTTGPATDWLGAAATTVKVRAWRSRRASITPAQRRAAARRPRRHTRAWTTGRGTPNNRSGPGRRPRPRRGPRTSAGPAATTGWPWSCRRARRAPRAVRHHPCRSRRRPPRADLARLPLGPVVPHLGAAPGYRPVAPQVPAHRCQPVPHSAQHPVADGVKAAGRKKRRWQTLGVPMPEARRWRPGPRERRLRW